MAGGGSDARVGKPPRLPAAASVPTARVSTSVPALRSASSDQGFRSSQDAQSKRDPKHQASPGPAADPVLDTNVLKTAEHVLILAVTLQMQSFVKWLQQR